MTSSSKLSNNIYDIYEILLRFNEILKKKSSEEKILEILLNIENNNDEIIYIKELNNGFRIGIGINKIIYIYDEFFNKVIEFKLPNKYSDYILFNDCEININEKEENQNYIIYLNLMICNNYSYLIILNLDKKLC